MRLAGLVLLALGCSATPAPRTVVVERPVYVYVPEKSGPPVPPGPGISESPLVVAAAQHREERGARMPTMPPPAEEPRLALFDVDVHVGDGYAPGYYRPWYQPVYAPTPRTAVVVVKDLPASERRHTKWHYERAEKRCDGRATKWARERCYRREAR